MNWLIELQNAMVTCAFLANGFFFGVMLSQMIYNVNLSWITVSLMVVSFFIGGKFWEKEA